MRLKIIISSLVLLLLFSCQGEEKLETCTLSINGIEISAELASTPEQREKGLMFRKELGPREGMLFVFEAERKVSFWMKNTYIPLSVAYINKKGVIKEIHDLQPESLNPVASSYSILYALEMNQGFFTEHGILTGDQILFPEDFPSDE